MFTGLVQGIGTVKRVSRGCGLVVEIECAALANLVPGESIAVDGACLTVAKCSGSRFTADVLEETESRTGLGGLVPGDRVNIERALRAGDTLGGHIVQGHVDARGTIIEKRPKGRDFQLVIRCGRVVAAGCVLKGSIAVDGVSLTISALGGDYIGVDLIPTTAAETTLGARRPGDKVNLETDVMGRYAAKCCPAAGLTEKKLREAGFIPL